MEWLCLSKIKFNSSVIENLPSTPELSPSPLPPPLPKPEEQIEERLAKITTQEAQWINDLFDNDAFDISPRLIKRFLNIYLISRHMYILEFDEQPNFSFMYWLALSVNYPYEAKALLKWMEEHNWKDPKDNLIELRTVIIKREYRDELNYKNDDFSGFDKFTKFYMLLQLDYNAIRNTKHITNCFNLILD